MRRIELQDGPLDERALVDAVTLPAAGAVVVFRGVVRDHHHGRAVERLEYSAYRGMALARMNELADELVERWPLHGVVIAHRLGCLEIGEVSVLIALSLAHRAEGFDALRHAIDEFKHTVPIWKKEFFADGDAEWVQQCC